MAAFYGRWNQTKIFNEEPMDTQSNNITEVLKSFPESLTADERKGRGLILFNRVQGALRHIPNFAETCIAILDAVMDEMDAENCSVMLKDPDSDELLIRAARGKHQGKAVYYQDRPRNVKQFKVGEGVAGWVAQRGEALLLNNVSQEPRFMKAAGVSDRVKSLVCVPLLDEDRVVGVLNLSHSRQGAFSEGDKLLLSYISNQVGAALTSARFFHEIQEMNGLTKDSNESALMGTLPEGQESFPLIEVGEMTPENGMFVYASEKMQRIKEMIDQVADTDVTVFIQGESGVGKEVVARSIHRNSCRKDKPFLKVNCAAIPQELLESELFGYEKGAFTGAYRQKPGKFELAQGGTILLDEIAEMSLGPQAKLLQVLQDREFSRLGGKKDIRVDVRVIAATNKNVEESVKNGQFREDLYYRMSVVNIHVPPLRERKEEIPIFANYFLNKFTTKYNKEIRPISERVMKIFMDQLWTGNVRELENVLHRYVALGIDEALIEELILPNEPAQITEKKNDPSTQSSRPSLREVHREAIFSAEYDVISKVLHQTNWNRKKSAELLSISYKALLYKVKGHEILKGRFVAT
jgi:two-component system response regulator AtoC